MALRITDDCLNCFACISDCPSEAISEGDVIHVIDPDRCTECVGSHDKPSCIEVCPVEEAIEWDPERVETADMLLDRWKTLHPHEIPELFDQEEKSA
ncbi:MAG TPA: YfhL family 4Fe-4S dicluster ferredoxin [Gammaproteobacteria bacterium]|jgi:ferredoxin|nr:4Fe-4S ferredoxin [Chromatiales bacterium]MCP4927023.1 YfhL family 4Fe-4S dicluster ferredoxin [Gammaproteobacteria bacterium]HJP39470.1 YfhL family 4Fe-4S dicluster ferredoxin [Gammaproteobacteria bacterium]